MRAQPPPCPLLGVLGPCSPALLWKVKQMPPGYLANLANHVDGSRESEARIQIWPLSLDRKSLGPSWLSIPKGTVRLTIKCPPRVHL